MGAAEFHALDRQRFSRFHLKTILVSGIGFFTDAMDIFVINLAIPMIAFVWYFKENSNIGKANHMPSGEMGMLKASTQVGTLLGQLIFGHLSDKLGRKSMYGLVLAIMIFGTLNTSLAAPTYAFSVGAILIFWRLVLGIGIGGDYPISAVITSEFASVHTRGLMIASVFAMQGIGILFASLCAVIVLACLKPTLQLPEDSHSMYAPAFDNVWRLLLFIGILPAIAAVYWRLQIPETPRFTANVRGDAEKAMRDMATVVKTDDIEAENRTHAATAPESALKAQTLEEKYAHVTFWQMFGNWKNGKVLFGCAMCWFLLDVGFYGVQLNQSTMISFMGYGGGKTPYEFFANMALGNLIISLCGTVPGYWFTVFLIEKMGRIKIQLMGFTILSIIFVVMTIFFDQLKGTTTFFVLYIVATFFFNFGPNATTFILPAEIFPTQFRSTCHGIAAATGKAGAIVSAFGFDQMKGANGEHMVTILAIFSACMIAGLLCTLLVPETKGKTLEELGAAFYDPEIVDKIPKPASKADEKV